MDKRFFVEVSAVLTITGKCLFHYISITNITMKLLFHISEDGICICDAGCSTGHVALVIGEMFPNSVIYGIDISEEAIAVANRTAKENCLDNVTFGVHNLCDLPMDWTNKWDVTLLWDVVHDVPETSKAFREVYRTLKPGGSVSMVDINMHTAHADNINFPHARFAYGMSLFQCMTLSLYAEGGEGMGAAWGQEKAVEMIRDAGFYKYNAIQSVL